MFWSNRSKKRKNKIVEKNWNLILCKSHVRSIRAHHIHNNEFTTNSQTKREEKKMFVWIFNIIARLRFMKRKFLIHFKCKWWATNTPNQNEALETKIKTLPQVKQCKNDSEKMSEWERERNSRKSCWKIVCGCNFSRYTTLLLFVFECATQTFFPPIR